ncbi:hypothetical protein CDAR_410921 [Caerostris darwini]|uniref:Uncharacterized protein n=1 Tax=Caerostris darwini TaxID=1538125 RepID=A0AAV4SCF9_9ARAC|nr:hypothetical protein CDAR_410921 [Caerostris darwini]
MSGVDSLMFRENFLEQNASQKKRHKEAGILCLLVFYAEDIFGWAITLNFPSHFEQLHYLQNSFESKKDSLNARTLRFAARTKKQQPACYCFSGIAVGKCWKVPLDLNPSLDNFGMRGIHTHLW